MEHFNEDKIEELTLKLTSHMENNTARDYYVNHGASFEDENESNVSIEMRKQMRMFYMFDIEY